MTTTTVVSDGPPPRELFKLARALARWRNRARRGRRIPEVLRAAAAGLARTYGVSRISAALKLSYYDLQRRARGQGALRPQTQAPPTFIEVPPPKASANLSSHGLLEVVHPGGARLLLRLPRARPEDLSALRCAPPNIAVAHRRVAPLAPCDTTPIGGTLAELGPLDIRLVRRAPGEDRFAHLLSQYHYLGYRRPVGAHLKYVVWAQQRPIACLGWSSAPQQLSLRDQWIGAPKAAYGHHLGNVP